MRLPEEREMITYLLVARKALRMLEKAQWQRRPWEVSWTQPSQNAVEYGWLENEMTQKQENEIIFYDSIIPYRCPYIQGNGYNLFNV